MAIGERIHHFRLLRGFTQKYLGQQLGFSDSQADVRIAQYEKGARSPKEKYQTHWLIFLKYPLMLWLSRILTVTLD